MREGMFWMLPAALGLVLAGCEKSEPPPGPSPEGSAARAPEEAAMITENELPDSESEWKRRLTAEQYRILRQKGTERPFTGKYWNSKKAGAYACAGCGQKLFESETKYQSGCGWPSFYQPAKGKAVTEKRDLTLGMRRTEVLCSRCGGHLGHVFNDGPQPTGMRYCINSAALKLEASEDVEAADERR